MIKKFFLWLGIGSIFIWFLLYSITQAVDTQLHLNIVNSFSGTVIITGTNIVNKNNVQYITITNPDIIIQSDAAWSYEISGDIQQQISGNQSQPYSLQTNIILKKTNNINKITPYFWKGWELLTHSPLQIFVDTQAPNRSTILSPKENSSIYSPIVISRTTSTDNGVWLKEYVVLIATDENFATTIYYQTTPNNEQYIDTTLLPKGKLYIKIFAKDKLDNISESETVSICNKESCTTTPTSWWGWGWGWWYIWWEDTSTTPKTEIEWITIIENLNQIQESSPKEEPDIGIIWNILYDQELIEAYKYAYNLGITTKPTAYQANLKGKLIRKDLAKMISEYAIKVVKKIPDNSLICNFNDIDNESLETKYYTKLACKLWLMWRHANGEEKLDNFMPYQEVDRAQFGTVLSRTLYGEKNNIQSGENYEWYQKHLLALNKNKIMNKINTPYIQELRWRVMLTMMRADPFYQIMHASPK